MIDAIALVIGILMLVGLVVLAGRLSHDDPLRRRRWDTGFDTEARRLKRTDATGVLTCRRCGASGSEKSGVCPKCHAML